MADSIPAMLEPGEYVLNRNAARAIGKDRLDELNYEDAPREGYQFGGQATGLLGSLLGLTQKKDEGPVYPKPDYTIPAGKNIFGQSTEEMGIEELLEMITQGGGAAGVLKKGAGATESTGKWAAKLLSRKRAKEVLPIAQKEGAKSIQRFQASGSKDKASEMSDVLANRDYTNFLKEYIKKGETFFPEGKQRGGSIDDFSLMDYMMPSMNKRLGPSLKKFQFGGGVPDEPIPGTTPYIPPTTGTQSTGTGALPTSPTGFGGGLTGTAQATLGTALGIASAYTPYSAQSQLAQSSGSLSTGIEGIFEESGFKTPGADYLEGLQAYDPTKQQRLQQDYGRKLPGPVGGAGGFAGSGAAVKKAGEQREAVTGQYQRGSEDLRKQYREDIMAQIAEDVASGTYEFEELGG